MSTRLASALAAALVLLGVAGAAAQAPQPYPTRPVRIVVPFAPGGGTDNLLRLLQPGLSAALGQQVIIDNRPGGGATIGTDVAARAAPDGYTLLASDSTFLINPGLIPNLPYDTVQAFAGVTMLAEGPAVLAAHPSVQARTVPELVELARARPGQISFASGGNGSLTHIAGELMNQRAGIQMLHVPYRGSAPAVADLLGGHVSIVIAGISGLRPHIQSGALRAIAVSGQRRSAALPDTPTFGEAGLQGIDASSYWVLVAPAGTPIEIRRRLRDAVAQVMRDPVLAPRLLELGFETIANSPEEQEAQIREMVAQWTAIVRAAGIQPDP